MRVANRVETDRLILKVLDEGALEFDVVVCPAGSY